MPSNFTELRVGGRFKADELRKISSQMKRGILTRAEFQRQKAELLGTPRNENEFERATALLVEALAMLAKTEAAPSPPVSNVVRFERRKQDQADQNRN